MNRRDFTKLSTLTAASLRLPHALAQNAAPLQKPIGFAAVGIGSASPPPSWRRRQLADGQDHRPGHRPSRHQGRPVLPDVRHPQELHLHLRDLRQNPRQPRHRRALHRPAQQHALRVHRARRAGRQAHPLREAHGHLQRRVPHHDRRLPQGRSQADDRLPHAVRSHLAAGLRHHPLRRARQDAVLPRLHASVPDDGAGGRRSNMAAADP
jgi:hypothetical protein